MALVVAAMTLVGLVLVRRHRGSARVGIAVSIFACGVVLIALPVWVAVRVEDRAVEEIARVVAASAGIGIDEATRRVRTDPDLAVRTDSSGVSLSIAGGVLVTLGGVTTLLWARRGPSDRLEDGP